MTVRPLSLLLLLIIAIPFEVTFLPGLPLRLPIDMCITLIAAFLLLQRSARMRGIGLEGWLLGYCVFAVFSVFYAAWTISDQVFSVLPADYGIRGSRYRGLYQLIFFIFSYLAAVVAVNGCTSRSHLSRVLGTIFGITLAVNAFAFYEFLAKKFGLPMAYPRFDSWDYVSGANFGGLPRLYSVFEEPGTYGRYLSMVIVISVVMLGHTRRTPGMRRFPLKLVLATSIICLIFTFSISSMIVLLLVIGLFALRQGKFKGGVKKLLQIMLPILAVLGVGLTSLGVDELLTGKTERMLTLDEGATANTEIVRTYGMMMGIKAVLERPLLGGGFGNEPFYTYMPEVSDLTFGSYNMLVTLLVEGGLVGALIFGWMFWRVFRADAAPQTHDREWTEVKAIMMGLKYALAAALLHHFMFGAARLTTMDWLLIGLIMAVSRMSNVTASGPTSQDACASKEGLPSHVTA